MNGKKLGITDLEHLLEINRSRGAFGNPNVSMSMINTILLFVYLGNKHQLCKVKSKIVKHLIIISPICLAVILGTRSGLIISILLGFLNVVNFDVIKIKKQN